MEISWTGTGSMLGCAGCVVATIVVAVAVAGAPHRQRLDEMRRWAAANGWTYTPRPDVDWGRRLPGRGRRGVSFAVTGTIDGRQVTVAEYRYREINATTDQPSFRTHRYVLTVVWLSRPGPTVAVVRRGALSQFVRSLFGGGTSTTGDEEFDRGYRVATDDPAGAASVLGPDLVAGHVTGAFPDWSMRGDELMAFRAGQLAGTAGIIAEAGPLLRVAELLDPNPGIERGILPG